jgi:hypothetical protein
MSKKRNRQKAVVCHSQCGGQKSSTSQKGTISSQTMLPWSMTPRSLPVLCTASTPPTKQRTEKAEHLEVAHRWRRSGNDAHAKRVPTVPGARGDRPLPKPQATRCAGCASRKRSEGGLAKVIESPLFDGQRLAVLVHQTVS